MNLENSAVLSFTRREGCPACLSREAATIYESRFDQGPIARWVCNYYGIDPALLSSAPYQLARCQRCTLIYQGWVGDDHLLSQLYGQWIDDEGHPDRDPLYQHIMRFPRESRDAHELFSAAAFIGKSLRQMTTLDYGMGWAMWARVALALRCSSFGCELSPKRAEFAREHGIKTLGFDEIPEEQFDFINTEQVMEHIPALRPTAERLASALRPGGILKISVPSAENVGPILAKLEGARHVPTDEEIMPVQPLEHVNSFTRAALRGLGDALGLQEVRPSIPMRYAFLTQPGSIGFRHPLNMVKELVRPFYTYRNPTNLYLWLQKPL